MEISIKKEFFEKNKEKAISEAVRGYHSKGDELYSFQPKIEKTIVKDMTATTMKLLVYSEMGVIELDISLGEDFLEKTVGVILKQFNKIKTMIESVK